MKKLALTIALSMFLLFIGCNSTNQKLAKAMLEKYLNNENYVVLTGEVVESYDNTVVIRSEQLGRLLSYEDEICEYYIYSAQTLELVEGTIIVFATVPFHFYNGHKLPIVELKIEENTLLSFEEGKANLIEWVKTVFV